MLRMLCGRRMSFVPQEHSYASPQKPLSRSCADHPRHPAQADQGSACLSPGASGPGGRGRPPYQHRLRGVPFSGFRPPQVGAPLVAEGLPMLPGPPALGATPQSHVRAATTPPAPLRSRPPPTRLHLFPVELSGTRHHPGPRDRSPAWPGKCPRYFKKKALSFYRPTGRLEPAPAALAYGSLELAALEYQARRGEIILLYADETLLWRFALPRAGWWRKAQRARLLTRPLSQGQIKQAESRKRQTWVQYRSWSRITSGVLLSVIGAVQYGTSKVFYKIVPHFDAQELRQYIHQVMAIFGKTGKEVVMVVDRSGIHRAHKLDATLEHYHNKFRFHFLPA